MHALTAEMRRGAEAALGGPARLANAMRRAESSSGERVLAERFREPFLELSPLANGYEDAIHGAASYRTGRIEGREASSGRTHHKGALYQ